MTGHLEGRKHQDNEQPQDHIMEHLPWERTRKPQGSGTYTTLYICNDRASPELLIYPYGIHIIKQHLYRSDIHTVIRHNSTDGDIDFSSATHEIQTQNDGEARQWAREKKNGSRHVPTDISRQTRIPVTKIHKHDPSEPQYCGENCCNTTSRALTDWPHHPTLSSTRTKDAYRETAEKLLIVNNGPHRRDLLTFCTS